MKTFGELSEDYPFIVIRGQHYQLSEEHVHATLQRAAATFAPWDAVYENHHSGRWVTATKVLSRNLRRALGLIP